MAAFGESDLHSVDGCELAAAGAGVTADKGIGRRCHDEDQSKQTCKLTSQGYDAAGAASTGADRLPKERGRKIVA